MQLIILEELDTMRYTYFIIQQVSTGDIYTHTYTHPTKMYPQHIRKAHSHMIMAMLFLKVQMV